MAYDGQIKYPKIEDIGWTSIDWDRSFMLAWNWENNCHVLKAQVKRLQDCEVKHEGLEHIIQDENGDEVAHLWFDQEKRALIGVWYAILGRERGRMDGECKCWVLIVMESPDFRSLKRVGMGWIQQRFILFDGQDEAVQII
jgi:hypothetical protein